MEPERLERWLRRSAVVLHEQRTALTELDQAIGDGDHGINMDRGFTAIVARLDGEGGTIDRATPATLLRGVGRTLISTVGGASGPLYGTAFLRAGAALDVTEPDLATGVAALEAAVGGIQALGKAVPGEKTMLDALIPAARAARAALEDGGTAADVLAAARMAADAGVQATVPLVATKGRASYLGERAIGHQDPGATSAALLLTALAEVWSTP